MSFARLHKLVAYLLSGLGLFALSLGMELSLAASAVIFVGFVGSLFAEGPLLHNRAYANAWTGAVLLFCLVQIARGLTEGATLSLALEFAAFLQVSRLFNRRTAADYQQIAVLAFLHLIAATVLSASLSYALVFIGFVIATPWMLALSHLRREIEGNYPADSSPGPQARTAIARVLASKRVVGPQFLVGTALLSLPLFVMTLVIFFTVPRVGRGFLSFDRSRGDRVAGFGNQVELGGFGVIRDDPSVVLRVTPVPSRPRKAPRLALRLRGTSFDHYDGRRWTRTPGEQGVLPRTRDGLFLLRRRPRKYDQELRIILDELDEPVVFVPEGAVAISVDPRIVHAQSVQRVLDAAPGFDIRYRSDDDLGLMYNVFVSDKPREQGIAQRPDERVDDYLQLPEDHERVAALAREVTAGLTDPFEKATRVRRYLAGERFRYSLEQPPVASNENPLDVFLFQARAGHCEYFSTAMAIMLRSVGVPARNVTGFAGGRYNTYGDYYALRQGDAHSWVEVLIQGQWLTFEPTPPARSAVGPRQGLWADLHAMMDAVRTRWITSVVGYDLRTQIGMMRKLALWAAGDGGDAGQTAFERERPDRALSGVAKQALRWLGAVGAAVLLALLWLRRARRGSSAERRKREEAVQIYQELERALARRGRPRPTASTPLEHATRLAEDAFPQAGDVMDVTQRYLSARYGGDGLDAEELGRLRQAVARIRRDQPAASEPGSSGARR